MVPGRHHGRGWVKRHGNGRIYLYRAVIPVRQQLPMGRNASSFASIFRPTNRVGTDVYWWVTHRGTGGGTEQGTVIN